MRDFTFMISVSKSIKRNNEYIDVIYTIKITNNDILNKHLIIHNGGKLNINTTRKISDLKNS